MDQTCTAGQEPGNAGLAIAIAARMPNLTVLTGNLRQFAVLDIPVINPFEAMPD